ncbi:MAG: hypothetical protein EOP92_08350 [Lysobacteraceae bacterium]|nr:MAG: hypothetical protein EOP92_08350 [Xanthomonadaceae bacterium]
MKAPKFRVVLLALSLIGLAACKPETPPTDEPPAPQAVAAEDTQLRDVIKQPLVKAKAVEDTVQEAADKKSAAIDAAAQ